MSEKVKMKVKMSENHRQLICLSRNVSACGFIDKKGNTLRYYACDAEMCQPVAQQIIDI